MSYSHYKGDSTREFIIVNWTKNPESYEPVFVTRSKTFNECDGRQVMTWDIRLWLVSLLPVEPLILLIHS